MSFKKFLFCLLALILLSLRGAASEPVNVAVASNMSHAMEKIAMRFAEESGFRPRLSSGSSGNFTRQLVQGAPYDIFLSADSKYIGILRENNISIAEDVAYVRGRIGLFVPRNSTLSEAQNLADLVRAMFHGRYARLVMANPEHAPYGLAAQQALQSAGLWVIEKQQLLLAENAAQATQTALGGDVDIGVIPASHAKLETVSSQGHFFLIPQDWHDPLIQHLVLLDDSNSSARQFFQFLRSETAILIMVEHGYTPASAEKPGSTDGLAGP